MTDRIAALAREVVDGSRYLVLATSDAGGAPWATPVWFATADRLSYYWVSRPDSRHSANLAGRPGAAAVLHDSAAPIGDGKAVYLELTARIVGDGDVPSGIAVFAAAAARDGAGRWAAEDVREPRELRLYRGDAVRAWVLGAQDADIRDPVPLEDLASGGSTS